MPAKFEVNSTVALQRLALYAKTMGIGMREALYEEWPFLMRKVMDFTPPFTTKGARRAAGISNSVSDQAIGRKAVALDIYKTMRPFDPKDIRSKGIQRIVDRKDVETFNLVASRSKTGLMNGARAARFAPTLHTSQRTPRGRVLGRPRNVVVLGTDARLLTNYVDQVQDNVGYAKSGWLKALNLVGGEAPAYVRKQWSGGGDVIDDHANETTPSITAINWTPWAVRKDEGDRILVDAYLSRGRAILSKLRAKARLAKEQAGFAA
jgi:hypothetical protein